MGVFKLVAAAAAAAVTTAHTTTTVDDVQHLVMPTIHSHHALHQVVCGVMNFQIIPLFEKYWNVFGSLMVLASSLRDTWMLAALSK